MSVAAAQRRACALLAAMLFLLLLILFADRPAASFAHATFGEPGREHWKQGFIALTHLVDPIAPLASVGLLASGAAIASSERAAPRVRAVFGIAAATLLAIAVKDQLKFACGRLWPETWINNNPSWIANGAYGFAPFHGGAGWASFPSGHMTAITAPLTVVMIMRPSWRVSASLPIALVAIGLYGADYHFLSDIVAGTLLGALCAAVVWTAMEPARSRSHS